MTALAALAAWFVLSVPAGIATGKTIARSHRRP